MPRDAMAGCMQWVVPALVELGAHVLGEGGAVDEVSSAEWALPRKAT